MYLIQRATMPASQLWRVPRAWAGETVYVFGGGPSAGELDPERLRGRRVIVINRGYQLIPWAEVLFFADFAWWNLEGADASRAFRGRYIVTTSAADQPPDPRLRYLRNAGAGGLSVDRSALKHGTNSGYQAIGLAFHFGARRIVLIGFDGAVAGDRTHWHEGYGIAPEVMSHVLAARMRPYFPQIAEPLAALGVEVVNANPESAIDCWPRVSLDEALCSGPG